MADAAGKRFAPRFDVGADNSTTKSSVRLYAIRYKQSSALRIDTKAETRLEMGRG